jgi:hypothetical protein
MTDVMFGPGINEVRNCKPSAAQPTIETVAHTPSAHANASIVSATPFPNPNDPVEAETDFVMYILFLP